MQAPQILGTWLAIAILGPHVLARYSQERFMDSMKTIFPLLSSYTFSLFMSMSIYRTIFHRLYPFPGPYLARISKLWHSYQTLNSKNFRLMDNLYHRYGSIVRIGPSELLIVDPKIFELIDGPSSRCKRTDWYDFIQPTRAIVSERDQEIHDRRRRLWDKGFSTRAVAEYERRVLHYLQKLEDRIWECSAASKAVHANEIFTWFAFDNMGDFAFAHAFGMLDTRKWHTTAVQLRRGMSLLGPLSSVPWVAQIGFRFMSRVWIVKDWFQMQAFCHEQMNDRVTFNVSRSDLCQFLIEDARQNGFGKAEREWLQGDAMTAVIAGSETIAVTLVFLFYRLCLHPHYADLLYEEVKDIDTKDHDMIRSLPVLNGLIKETMRLHPALPSAVYRETPPEGIILGNVFIPGRIKITAPRYTISRRT